METLRKSSFFVLAALLAFSTTRAQTADDIVNKYVAAIGGRDALNSIKSLVLVGSTEVMGQSGNTTVSIVVGKGYKTVSDIGGTSFVTAVTPTQGWGINPYMGATTPTAMPEEPFTSTDQA